MWKRALAVVLALLMGAQMAVAEEMTEEEQLFETAQNVVEALFEAVAGTNYELEKAERKGLRGEDKKLMNEENAAYRAQTVLWLREALTPVEEDITPTPAPASTPAPDVSPQPTLDPQSVYELFMTTVTGQAYVELMGALGFDGADGCMQGTKEWYAYWRSTIDVEKLREINGDYVAWIYLPGTMLDYPVVQGEDNEFYLKRMFNGESNSCGTIFVDARNLPGFRESNTLMYGHHMRNGSMFKAITYYEEQEYFEAHPYLLIVAPEAHYVVELIAGYTTDSSDHCYDIALSDFNDMQYYLTKAKQKSDFDSTVEVERGDRLVTLSTCAYAFEDARYITIGKLTQLWQYVEPEDAL